MERNGLGYALGIFIFLVNNFRLVSSNDSSSNFLHQRSSIFQIFLKNLLLCCSARRGLPFGVPSLPCRFEFGGKLSFLVRNSEFSPFNYQEQNDSEGEIDGQTCRSKMEKFRVIEWKNDWKLLHGRDTVTRFPSRTLQKSDRVTSIAKFHRPRFFRLSTPRLELKEFLPSTPYLWNAVSLHSISSLTIFSRWRGETLLKILRDFFRTREKGYFVYK